MRITKILQDYTVANSMTWNTPTIADDATVEEALRWYGERRTFLFVTHDGTVVGVVDGRRLRSVGEKVRSRTKIAQVMTAAADAPVATMEDNMADVLQRMELEDVFDLPVVQEGRVVGHVGDSFLPIFARHPELAR
jgi:predicted transcriptional regulator